MKRICVLAMVTVLATAVLSVDRVHGADPDHCVPRGASYAMVPAGFNDQISSIRIMGAGGVMIFVDRDFGGDVARVTSDVPDLRRGVWNDRISSIRVY